MGIARSEVQSGYRPDIDGLRAIAVIAVISYHAGLPPFTSGYVGVDIFFVISGYLIGGIILREVRAGQFSFAAFYARRARRILPALLTVVVTSCVAGWFLLSPYQFRDVGATATSALLGMSNISYFRFKDYFASDARLSPLLMTWSLGVEEQFYLFFPLLMFAIIRWAPRRTMLILTVVTLASFLASVWAVYAHPAAAFYLLPFRSWELGTGVILAFTELTGGTQGLHPRTVPRLTGQITASAGLVLVAVSVLAFDETTPFPGLVAALPVLGTAVLIHAKSSWVNRHLLSARPLVFIGTISYSWYLWHWPLISFVRNVAFDDPPIMVLVLIAALAFGVAVISWRFIERPFRHGPVRVRSVLTGYAAALTVALACSTTIKLSQGFPAHVSPQARQIDAERAETMGGPCLMEWDDEKPNLSPACVAERQGHPTVALIGDSHAASLSDGIRILAGKQDWGYEILAKAMCRPLVGVTNWYKLHPQQAETCAAFMDTAFAQIISDPSVDTVILAGLWPHTRDEMSAGLEHFLPIPSYPGSTRTTDLFYFGLQQAVAKLAAAGKHVMIMGDVPIWRFNVGQAALTQANPVRSFLAPWLWTGAPRNFPDRPGPDFVYAPIEGDADFLRSLAQQPMVTYIDLFARFCSDAGCIFKQDGVPLFIDHGHLSNVGARFALQNVRLPDPSKVALSAAEPSIVARSPGCQRNSNGLAQTDATANCHN